MTMETQLIKETREEALREVEANRLARRAWARFRRGSRFGELRFAVFAREVGIDFVRLAGAIRVSGKAAKRKGRR